MNSLSSLILWLVCVLIYPIIATSAEDLFCQLFMTQDGDVTSESLAEAIHQAGDSISPSTQYM